MSDDLDGGLDRRRLLEVIGLSSLAASGTVASQSPTTHESADVEVSRAKLSPNADEWQVRADLGNLNDDDRVVIEPPPSDPFYTPTSFGNQLHQTMVSEGDRVMVYSLAFDGPVTVHFDGTVSELEDVSCEIRIVGCDEGDPRVE